MIDHLERIELTKGVNLHLVNSSKFKTVLFGVYIQRPLCRQEASMNAIISRVIEKGNRTYKTPRQVSEALDHLYGSVLVSDVHKYGEKQLIQVKMQMPSDLIIKNDSLMDEGVKLLNEIINHPLIVSDGFESNVFEMERKGLIDELKMRIEDKAGWALDLCIEKMCENEPYAIHEYGDIEDLKRLNPKDTLKHYKEILKTSPMDIIIIGNFDSSAMLERIKGEFEIYNDEKVSIPKELIVESKRNCSVYEEFHDIKQGRLVLGYRMNVDYMSNNYVPALLASMILGNGASSKLFKEVREREGLCYSVFARADKFKSIMLIYAGVEPSNFQKAQDLILEKVNDLKIGKITEAELSIAKSNLVSMFSSMSDFPNSYINFYFGQYLTAGTVDLEEYQKKLKNINLTDVIKASQNFDLGQIVKLNKESGPS